jgi:AcrR family transcriptional regulator
MATRPYHHGNLRETLLLRAQATLRERGAAALSLRELAREAGVSHAAPRRHFPDRQALLDALALAGFARLGTELRSAVAGAPEDLLDQLRASAHAYIGFAAADAELHELMFTSKHGVHAEMIDAAATEAFGVLIELVLRGQAEGALPAGDPERVGMLHLATMQGIATLVASGMIEPERVPELVEESIAQRLGAARAQTQA